VVTGNSSSEMVQYISAFLGRQLSLAI
jgi:hypothetical protein